MCTDSLKGTIIMITTLDLTLTRGWNTDWLDAIRKCVNQPNFIQTVIKCSCSGPVSTRLTCLMCFIHYKPNYNRVNWLWGAFWSLSGWVKVLWSTARWIAVSRLCKFLYRSCLKYISVSFNLLTLCLHWWSKWLLCILSRQASLFHQHCA